MMSANSWEDLWNKSSPVTAYLFVKDDGGDDNACPGVYDVGTVVTGRWAVRNNLQWNNRRQTL